MSATPGVIALTGVEAVVRVGGREAVRCDRYSYTFTKEEWSFEGHVTEHADALLATDDPKQLRIDVGERGLWVYDDVSLAVAGDTLIARGVGRPRFL